MTLYLQKSNNVDADVFDGDLILMNLDTRQVLVLNEAAHVLWSAMDSLSTRDELLDLLREAMPQTQPSELGTKLDEILDALLSGGFLQAAPERPAGDAQATAR
jgi:hypothetical protein